MSETPVIRQNKPFEVISPYTPSGDQPKAIRELAARIRDGEQDVVLMGATGTGKSATTAWLIEELQRPALVLEPNKTLAAQLAAEFRELLPNNAVEYFVSYYDYYQPEAYVPQTDTFIEKDSSINDEVERLRHSATNSLLTRRDTVVVSSVSCIYGLGTPEEYVARMIELSRGMIIDRDTLLRRFVAMQYVRNDMAFTRGTFRVRGDTIEIIPVYEELAIRIEMFGDEIDSLAVLHPLTGDVISEVDHTYLFPASHYVAGEERMKKAIASIEDELDDRLAWFRGQNKLLEEQRLRMRTTFDLEMLKEIGSCSGVENYSRHIDGRGPGTPPHTLLDYFPDDFLLIIDESHVTVPQIGAMFEGDMSRKRTLVDYGFRLPSAMDNRPLKWDEFTARIGQTVYLSATPGPYELERSDGVVEQIIRSTGLVDPLVVVKPTEGRSTTSSNRYACASNETSASLSPPSRRRWPRSSRPTWPSAASKSSTCTPTSTRCAASSCCANCAWVPSTCSWASTCCARAWTCPRSPSCPSSTPTRKASCARPARSSRRSVAPHETCPAKSTCTRTT